MSGRRITLPCSHEGVAVIGQFYLCSVKGCDTRADEQRCSKCGGTELYEFTAPMVPDGALACRGCGAVKWSPT